VAGIGRYVEAYAGGAGGVGTAVVAAVGALADDFTGGVAVQATSNPPVRATRRE
jgi:hypothetical protein